MAMNTRYHSKAEAHACYRWDYSPEAIQVIVELTRDASCIADIGSGTGILARHFAGRVQRLFCVEPDSERRRLAQESLSGFSSFQSISGTAEDTGLPDQSVHLITVGQAIHWFEPGLARKEFLRICRPPGWLAILWNHSSDVELNRAFSEISTEENGWQVAPERPQPAPLSFYYSGEFLQMGFPNQCLETWEQFFGVLYSDSHAPDPDHPRYPNFVSSAEAVFRRLSLEGGITISYATELVIGRMKAEG